MLRIADGEMKKSSSILIIQKGGKIIKKMKHKVTPKVTLKYRSKVRSIELYLPNGLIMELQNVYIVSSIFRNIISISCLEMNDFSFVIKDNGYYIYKDELYYGSSFMMNGLYMLEIDKLVFNINKRHKTSHESTNFM
jgi:hypothetical protein